MIFKYKIGDRVRWIGPGWKPGGVVLRGTITQNPYKVLIVKWRVWVKWDRGTSSWASVSCLKVTYNGLQLAIKKAKEL